MPDRTEQQTQQRIAQLRLRLQSSRDEIFTIAHQLKGDQAPPEELPVGGSPFPQSRIMRALMGNRGRLLVGGAAVALTLLRPKLLWRAVPMLRPLLMRYVLPRLLGQR